MYANILRWKDCIRMTKKQPIEYTQKYTTLSREEIIEEVRKRLTEYRFEHVLRVEETALELAEKYDVDLEKTSIAALLHDVAKDEPDNEMRDIVISENLDLDLLQFGSQIWHAPVGAVQARRDFEIVDEDILNAIKHHTVGAPEMSDLEKVVFIADYIEPGRDFEGAQIARELAEESLDEAIKYKMKSTVLGLAERNKKIYPKAIDSYNAWIPK